MTTVEKRAPATFDVVGGSAAPGLGGYRADDLLAVQAGAESDGLVYRGASLTTGHRHIRHPARAVLIRRCSSDGCVGWSDGVTVQYSGFAGRELPINPDALAPQLDVAVEARNAVGAARTCRAASVAVFIGGSCSETDVSARASVQLAVAAGAEQVLAKAGMGVDEAFAITQNEVQRACM